MRDSGRLTAAIEVLGDFNRRRTPLKSALADWSRNNRYAGAKDRAWISGLCLDALRHKSALEYAMESTDSRALGLAALRFIWNRPVDEIAQMAEDEPHGAGALSAKELSLLKAGSLRSDSAAHISHSYPEWMSPMFERVLGDDLETVMAELASRADIDLRVNTLKASIDQATQALKKIGAVHAPVLANALRIPAPDPSERAAAVTVIPAYNKGWVEIQDLGSQISSAAAGDIKNKQVLDYCAGGGGKTLALAALMENTGQIYAYDRDPRRLKPLFHRAKRAGVRNLQIRSPAGNDGLQDLQEKMDVVVIDAPCTGVGTWRRRPDTKWRLTEKQLATRIREQDQVLREAGQYVKPGGRMVWITCSILMEENEDRLVDFLAAYPHFEQIPTLSGVLASGLVESASESELSHCETSEGALRLTPDKIRADGFFIATLRRTN